MTAIAWTLIGFGIFCFGFHLGSWWAGLDALLVEQQRAVAECRRRQKRIEWPANWGEG